MAEKQEEINEITVTRSTKVKGKFVERGRVLAVGADLDKNDARFLLRNGKALPGKQTRIAEAHAAEKKSAELARAETSAGAGNVAELEKQLDEADAQLEAAEDRAAAAEARALEAEKRAAEAEKALAAANKKGSK
ncbi:hypothetical protein [Microbulbifer sp. ARAS458-1]|uniref:hypothetical protein n=1 Tax=Microbulbifer sp. ARAS458-1 TaxID=3140242 RepID=UPI003877B8DE